MLFVYSRYVDKVLFESLHTKFDLQLSSELKDPRVFSKIIRASQDDVNTITSILKFMLHIVDYQNVLFNDQAITSETFAFISALQATLAEKRVKFTKSGRKFINYLIELVISRMNINSPNTDLFTRHLDSSKTVCESCFESNAINYFIVGDSLLI